MRLLNLKKNENKNENGYLSNPMSEVNLLRKTGEKAKFYEFLQELNSKVELGDIY